ncbi:MAG: hypothetical protein IJT91_05755 [Clostridia bacterium]|nr:hypothetical protein [Clostridia bacterium]
MRIDHLRITALFLALILLLSGCGSTSSGGGTTAEDEEDIVPENCFTVTLEDEPWDIYTPYEEIGYGYRYGPSIMVTENDTVNAWYSSLGAFGQADFILHNSSSDGGHTWTDEDCALMPTADSWDSFSCCDPCAVYFGGYYYIAYTSTIDTKGYCNSAFVARCDTIDGTYEKWNGSGWGGNSPMPFIRWDGIQQCWGIGEVSFVVMDDTLYIYYTMRDLERNYACLATADVNNENWPGELEYHGMAVDMDDEESGVEFRYVDEYESFIAVSVASVRSKDSYLIVYTSQDGENYTATQRLTQGMHSFAHNPGLSGDERGHITDASNVLLGYAYGDEWGTWATCLQKLSLIYSEKTDFSDMANNEVSKRHKIEKRATPEEFVPVTITTKPHKYVKKLSDGNFAIEVYQINSMYQHVINTVPIKCSGYDESVVSITDATVTPVGVGETWVDVECIGKHCVCKIIICADDVDPDSTRVVSFSSFYDKMTVKKDAEIPTQIRAIIGLENTVWGEASNIADESAVFPKKDYELTYESSDPDVLLMTDSGLITPFKTGTSTVKVRLNGQRSFTVEVTVE